MEGVLAIIFIFGGGTLFLLSMSPVGKAFAERLRAHGAVAMHDPELLADVDALRQEVAHLRAGLSEMQERMDFAERLLPRREPPAFPNQREIS